ncbi:MAG: right-handed parallel beta-helix repeat-containing protein [Euryarchaeota archaeon]|nr:right-handed parallel beta-helix repeat-containing protein [Euryarchaeota archaeon]
MTRIRMLMLTLIAAAVCMASAGVGAAATTWYVDDGGGADYDTLQGAVDVAGAGDTIYVYDGIYNEQVIISTSITVSGQSESNVTIDGGGSGDCVQISSSDVTINGFTITNASRCGIRADYSDIVIENVTVTTNGGHGIYFVHGKSFTIRNSTIDGNGGGMIYYDAASGDAIVENNTVTNNVGSGVHISLVEGKSATVKNNKINNNAGGSSDGIYVNIAGSGGVMNIENNPVTKSGRRGMYLRGVRSGSTIANFAVQGSGSHGIRAEYSDLEIENVTVTGNGAKGIYFVHGKSFTIRNSTIDGNAGGVVYDGNRATGGAIVEDTTITNNVGSGLRIDLTEGNSATIRNNKIDNNAGSSSDGIYVYIQGTGGVATIKNNLVEDSGRYGIYLTGATNSVVAGNNIVKNSYGMRLYSSSNNLIFHNNFIDNINYNGYDDGDSNSWDDGYLSAGNYWGDHDGADDFKGPGQNQSGKDGIIDTPYPVQGGSGEDRYPLVKPWPLKGDLNSDHLLTSADAAIALRIAASGGWDADADVSRDGQITSLDALMILQAVSGGTAL